ncbi:MAG: hypothetical protein K0S16_928 [Moraxellaceae bacterium]|nr:hypothetical protein [Moraxellaceae bacterium]
MKPIFLVLAVFFAAGNVASAGELSPAGRAEVAHLFAHLQQSGCQFNRNGSWYAAGEAVAHLQKKFDYLQKKKLVASAEDFIARAASESSVSGKPYLVKCGATAAVPSGAWFRAALEKYRQAAR